MKKYMCFFFSPPEFVTEQIDPSISSTHKMYYNGRKLSFWVGVESQPSMRQYYRGQKDYM